MAEPQKRRFAVDPDPTPLVREEQDVVEQELLNSMFGGGTDVQECSRVRTDLELGRAVAAALGTHAALTSKRVLVEVSKGWVSVDGTATDSEWSELERLVLSVQGVAGVRLNRGPSSPSSQRAP
jgi:osmotically-inducible protein OsmY